jgi:predicted alpha/beta-fold hydrolase
MEPRNGLYQWSFLRDCRRQFTFGLSEEDVRLAHGVRSLWEFDEQLTAPHNGFTNAADYYRRSSAQRFLAGIAVPTLLLHAIDDPIVPVEAYRAYPWTRYRRLVPAIESKGGHVGFHDRGGGVWYHHAAELFFRRVLSLS